MIRTCAVAGNQATPAMPPHLPITPSKIAEACLGAAAAVAAIVHIHVRDYKTGTPSMEIDLYREAMQLIRAKNLEKGVLAKANAAMVQKARGIIESLGGQIATASRAREMLSLAA